VDEYNHLKLHSAIGYTTPLDRYLGLDEQLQLERKEKLKTSSKARAAYWQSIQAENRTKAHHEFRKSLRGEKSVPL
jgi:hypothetical protein